MMTEKEMQAHDMVRRRSWSRAVALYDQILATANSNNLSANTNANSGTPARAFKDQQIACLLGRCECLLELGKFENCLTDARKVLVLLADQTDCLASLSRARRWLIHALCKLHKYVEAEHILREWISELSGQQIFSDISKTLERYKSILQLLSGHHKNTQKISHGRLEDEMSILDTKLDHWATNNLPLDKYSKLLSNKGLKKREQHPNSSGGGSISSSSNNTTSSSFSSNSSSIGSSCGSGISLQKTNDMLANLNLNASKQVLDEQEQATTCSYCAITFQTRNELRQHCLTESHQKVIMSDEGRDWKWRPPPRGFTLDTYSLCEAFSELHTCHYGNQCVEAHGLDELNEWKERFEYRRMRLQKACEKELYGKSYTEQILERWIQATSPERVMCEKVEDVDIKCEQELVTSISSKTSKREWIFELKTIRSLKAVALLQDAHRNHFAIKAVKLTAANESIELKSDQEWITANNKVKEETAASEVEVTIEFHTEIYGTFRQAVCFDFGSEPLLVKHLCVDVVPVNDAEKIEEIKRDIINSSATRWDNANTNLVKFETTIGAHLKTEAYWNDIKHEKEMLERYPCPRAQTFTLTQSTIVEKRLTQNNYRSRIHELLYVEEIARYEQIARYNVRTKLMVATSYILTPAGMATSTAKYSLSGELFALMRLGKDISEDTSPGRLILSNCSSVYISTPEELNPGKDRKRNVYEALIEDKGKNVIYLKLSAKCVEAMGLKPDIEIDVDIQFQLNRLPYCEWHNAVDKITDFKIIFPTTDVEPNIPWTPKKQWSDACEPKLNAKQREAVNAITTSLSIKLPPILLIGPFGTGKTYTLAQAIKQLISQPEAKILICTHSNSAADLYIKEYLHPWIENGLQEAIPLRVYYHKRWVATVNNVVQKYCITDGSGNFRRPTVDDIMKHRIVVVTLSISMELATLGLPKGYFTHIFLDEAAQAMECEAIMPLALANDATRIVLAGDHMQMSPELFSAFAKERKLHHSLLERLYDHYPSNFPCKILLCENYRAHEAIIKFTSELFYEQKLIASGKQPRHERFYPLTFFTTRGEDVQDKNSTAFYNNAEVYEVVERVSELRKRWPTAWGKINDASIGIMTPYADQVFRIRSELRKRRMGGISVERVLNVQGKQFRAVFLSTVRTRRTCMPQFASGPHGQALIQGGDDADYGFLSNSKLLNTAITRAQSLVAVVGDPVALCSIGRCRKVWERFIEICDEHKSLFGLTWSNLRSQLDGVELKRNYVLNPLAPEFIPRALQPEAYLREQAAMYLNSHHSVQHAAQTANNYANMQGHPGMFGGPGGVGTGGQIPMNQMAAAMAANQQLSQMFGQHTMPYNAAAAMMAASKGNGPHHFPGAGHMNHMHGMSQRGPPGPSSTGGPPQSQQSQQQQPQQQQQQQPSAPPPPHLRGMPPQILQQASVANTNPYATQYMQHWQQPPLRPPNSAPTSGAYVPPSGGQVQNPNASLWGPPPQSNPWGVLPNKQQMQPPPPQQQQQQAQPSVVGSGSRMPPAVQPPNGQPTTTSAGAAVVGGNVIRGGSVPLQPPPPPPPNQANPMLRNPSELGYLAKKTLYNQQHTPVPPQAQAQQPQQPPHVNAYAAAAVSAAVYPTNPLPPMLNQRGSSVPNGPISPMESPYMQRPLNGPQQQAPPPQHNYFGKDKDYQFLNMPQNMYPLPANSISGVNKQQSPSTMSLRFPQPNEYSHLLPPNMTIYDMSFEAKETQYKWYLKLLETHGQEAANKFADVLRQVMTTLHPAPAQHSKPQAPPMQQQHQQQQQQQHQQQLLQRDLMQTLPPHSMSQQMQPTAMQQQQRFMHTGMPNASTNHNLNSLPSVDTPPLDGSINFNQQIDLVFNSIMNGNNIAQPILRDVLGMVMGSSPTTSGNCVSNNSGVNSMSNGGSLLNGDLLLGIGSANNLMPLANQHSRLFNMLGGQHQHHQQQQQQVTPQSKALVSGAHMYTNHMSQQQQTAPQQQQGQTNYLGNAALLNNKDLLFNNDTSTVNSNSAGSISSVPLYRRQPMAISNTNGGGIGGNNGPNYNSSEVTAFNMLAGGNGTSMGSGTSTGTSNSNIILPGLDTGTNLIEALFQANNATEQTNKENNMLYNDFGNSVNVMKTNNLELYHGNAAATAVAENNVNTAGNLHQHHQQHQQQQHQRLQPQQQHHHFHNVSTTTDNRLGTTYAAVLSQGPQAQQAQVPQPPPTTTTQQIQPQQLVDGITVGGSGSHNIADKDPFAAIRELGQGRNGFYNYFQ